MFSEKSFQNTTWSSGQTWNIITLEISQIPWRCVSTIPMACHLEVQPGIPNIPNFTSISVRVNLCASRWTREQNLSSETIFWILKARYSEWKIETAQTKQTNKSLIIQTYGSSSPQQPFFCVQRKCEISRDSISTNEMLPTQWQCLALSKFSSRRELT